MKVFQKFNDFLCNSNIGFFYEKCWKARVMIEYTTFEPTKDYYNSFDLWMNMWMNFIESYDIKVLSKVHCTVHMNMKIIKSEHSKSFYDFIVQSIK